MAELIGGSGYDDVQNTAPTSPSIGDTWLDTSTDPPTGKIYADLGGGGQWTTDLIDAQITSRATQSDILSDGTPFDGAKIDKKISETATNYRVSVPSDSFPFSDFSGSTGDWSERTASSVRKFSNNSIETHDGGGFIGTSTVENLPKYGDRMEIIYMGRHKYSSHTFYFAHSNNSSSGDGYYIEHSEGNIEFGYVSGGSKNSVSSSTVPTVNKPRKIIYSGHSHNSEAHVVTMIDLHTGEVNASMTGDDSTHISNTDSPDASYDYDGIGLETDNDLTLYSWRLL